MEYKNNRSQCLRDEKKVLIEAYKARVKLRTRLNMNIGQIGNEYNRVLDDILRDLKFEKLGDAQCKDTVEKLTYLSRKILEPE